MKVKVGDTVKVICGKDKGKEGKVTKTFKKESRVIVEAINIIKKHQKPNNTNETGGILEREAPIHVSNVKVVASKKETKEEKPLKKEAKVEKKEKEVKEVKKEKVENKPVKKTVKKDK